MAKQTNTSREANDVFRVFAKASGARSGFKNALARIAAAMSLKQSGARDFTDALYDRAGGFRIHMLNLDPHGALSAYVAALYGIDPTSAECVDLVCNHVNEGAKMLQRLYHENSDFDQLFAEVESQLAPWDDLGRTAPVAPAERMEIVPGHIDGQRDKPFYWRLNDSQANPHTAILGETRSGKTQLLLDILSQVRDNSAGRSNFFFLAYRKDDALDEFADDLGIDILDPDEEPLPINPFILSDYSDREIVKSAQEKCDLMAAFDASIRGKQKGYLRDGIVRAYEARRGSVVPYPDFDAVRELVLQEYGDARDTLTEMLESFVNLSLFERAAPTSASRRFLSDTSTIVKLQGVPDKHRAIVASLILESFVRECGTLPRAEVDSDTGTRAIRSCIVIDEAHNYLQARNIFLEKLLRESADSGFVVMLATQTPKSLCASQDFRELIGTFFVFRCRVTSNEAQLLTGCRSNAKQEMVEQVQNLPPGHCFVNRSQTSHVAYSSIEAVQWYKRKAP